MKTLVLHMKDETTDFLKAVYRGKDWEVVDYDIPLEALNKKIEEADRIIALGHGSPWGLFGYKRLWLSSANAHLLQGKKLVTIWCYASSFIAEHNLEVELTTGMFISETGEADMLGVDATQEEIDDSNYQFAALVGNHIDDHDLLGAVYAQYKGDSDVIVYNRNLLERGKIEESTDDVLGQLGF